MASVTITSSANTSHKPLEIKNPLSCFLLFLKPCKYAEVPDKKTNTGAQKCVIHRVRNRKGVVV